MFNGKDTTNDDPLVAADSVFSDTPAIDDGSTQAQIFCGIDSLVTDSHL